MRVVQHATSEESMTRRRLPIVLSALFAALLMSTPAAAGNWATATMDPVPEPAAGLQTILGFEILQHGETPISWVTATFVATNLETGAQVQFPMRASGDTGRYITEVTFPAAGSWSWYVMVGELGSDQEGAGGTLTVLEPMDAAMQRLTDLGAGLKEPLTLVSAFARWLEAAGRSAGAG
jgi:hypothetical protein